MKSLYLVTSSILLGIILFAQVNLYTLKAKRVVHFSVEEFMNVKLISAPKLLSSIYETLSIITVITNNDIFEQGVKTLKKVLPCVPFLYTSHSSSRCVFTNRGIQTNKLSSLFNGHSVNSIVNAIMFQHYTYPLLCNIKQQKAIHNPRSTLWESESAPGVINMITKCLRNNANLDK